METKTDKTPLVLAKVYDLSCCHSALGPESKLSPKSEAQHGLVPKLSHHSGKNLALRAKKQVHRTSLYIVHGIMCFSVKRSGTVFLSTSDINIFILHKKDSGAACRWPSAFVPKTRGKSGQHRALRYLTGRSPRGLARAEENNRRNLFGKGEKVG